jgi:hypothetical protein
LDEVGVDPRLKRETIAALVSQVVTDGLYWSNGLLDFAAHLQEGGHAAR